jgi:hypothetical protein
LKRRIETLRSNVNSSSKYKLKKFNYDTLIKRNKNSLIKSIFFYQMVWSQNSDALCKLRFEMKNIYIEMRHLMAENMILHECKDKRKYIRKIRNNSL